MHLQPLEQLALIRQGREELAIQTLAGFLRYMWGVTDGDTSDGLDDVRQVLGLDDGAGCRPSGSDENTPGADAVKRTVARQRAGQTLIWGVHLDIMCTELEALARGYTIDADGQPAQYFDELIIDVPPGSLKSNLCSVMFPAWLWLHDPSFKLWCSSHAGSVARRDSRCMRILITSERYKRLQRRMARNLGHQVEVSDKGVTTITSPLGEDVTARHMAQLSKDQYEKMDYTNSLGGKRFSATFRSDRVGQRCDGMILDDPQSVADMTEGTAAAIKEHKAAGLRTYNVRLSTRVNAGGWRMIIAQLLASGDLASSRLPLSLDPHSTTRAVVLPARYNPDHPYLYEGDPRTVRGELLFPALHDDKADAKARRDLGERDYAAQYDQLPLETGSGQFREEWFAQRYPVAPQLLLTLATFRQVGITVDCTFKGDDTSDDVSLQVWGLLTAEGATAALPPGKYKLDNITGKMSLLDTCRALRVLAARWPDTVMSRHGAKGIVLVELAANGFAVIEIMRAEGHPGVIGYRPQASKPARAQVSALSFEAAEVWLPLDEHAPWMPSYVKQHVRFPKGADDQVDATAQILIRWGSAVDLVYASYTYGAHVIAAHTPPKSWPRYCAAHFSWAESSYVLWGAVRPDGVLEVYRELVMLQARPGELAQAATALRQEAGERCTAMPEGCTEACQHCRGSGYVSVEEVAAGWAAASQLPEMTEATAAGLPLYISMPKSEETGINAVNARLTDTPPTLVIHSSCQRLLQEISSYCTDAHGRPVQADAGACATLRILTVGVDAENTGFAQGLALEEPDLWQENPWDM